MIGWIKRNHNQLAVAVWIIGLMSLYQLWTQPTNLNDRHAFIQHIVRWFIVIAAGPVGWALTRRANWAKWIVAATCAVICLSYGLMLLSRPSLYLAFAFGATLYTVFLFVRWDMTRTSDSVKIDPEALATFLESHQPMSLPESTVSLKYNVSPSITTETLAAAISKALGRECKVSESTDNIDLGIEAAMTDHQTAVVGGFQNGVMGSWMVGASPVAFQVAFFGFDNQTLLTISTPQQIDREASHLNGYDWTIPLAVALWSPEVSCATVGEPEVRFTSPNDLLDWHKMSTSS